jgi:ELWxxDGT repeat protein
MKVFDYSFAGLRGGSVFGTASRNARAAFDLSGRIAFLVGLFISATALADTVQQVKDINSGVKDSLPAGAIEYNGQLFFSADDGTNGRELWVSDGTDAGTAMLVDIQAGHKKGSAPDHLTLFQGQIFFSADDGINGRELWVTDGSAAGTALFKDINAGTNIGSSPSGLVVFNNALYFAADDGINGREVWSSDGTAAGTALAHDINAGSGASMPAELAVADNKLYFQADGGTDGVELWVIEPSVSCDYPLDASEQEVLAVTDGKLYPLNADQSGEYTIRSGLAATEAYAMFSSGITGTGGQYFDVSSGVVAMGLSKDALPDVGAVHGVSTGDVAIQFVFFDETFTEVGHVNYQYDATGHWIGLGIGPGTDYFYETDGSQVSFWFDANTGTFGAGYTDTNGNPQLATRASYTATSVTPVLAVYEQGSVDPAFAGQTVAATVYSDPANITAPVPAGAVAPCGLGI